MERFSRQQFVTRIAKLVILVMVSLASIISGRPGDLFGLQSAGAQNRRRKNPKRKRGSKPGKKKPGGQKRRAGKRRGGKPKGNPRKRKPAGKGGLDILIFNFDDMADYEWAGLPRLRSILSRDGSTYPNFVCENPVCGPARASLLTGRASHNTGVRINTQAKRGLSGPNLVSALRKRGFKTAIFGKYLNGYGGKPQGFDFADTRHAKHVGGVYIADHLKQTALKWMKKNPKGPRFLYFGFPNPHQDYIAAKRHRGLYKGFHAPRNPAFNGDMTGKPPQMRDQPLVNPVKIDRDARTRMQSLASCDAAAVAVINKSRKQRKQTVIVALSDNGWQAGEHRGDSKGVPYDASLRVTMYAVGPGISKHRTSNRLVAVQDIAPTIARIAGVRLGGTDGRDFRQGNPEFRLIQFHQTHGSGPWAGLQGITWRYVHWANGFEEYYDLAADPHEQNNLIGDDGIPKEPLTQDRLIWCRQKLEQVKRCKGRTCP